MIQSNYSTDDMLMRSGTLQLCRLCSVEDVVNITAVISALAWIHVVFGIMCHGRRIVDGSSDV
jgi:hypothetical protein